MALFERNAKARVAMVGTSANTMGGIATVVQEYTHAGLFERVPVDYITTHCDGSALRKLGYALAGYCRFLATIVLKKVAVIHVHLSSRASFWRKLPIFLLARALRYPYLLHLHGSEFMTFYQLEAGRITQAIIRYVFDHADIVLTLSPEWQQNVCSFSQNSDIRVFPNGVFVADSAPRRYQTSGILQLLFLGRLGKRKGIYDLLNALSQLRPSLSKFVLIAAGDGETEKVSAEAARLGLADKVVVPGWIDAARRQELLQQSDIFLLPSHAEGLPMSLLEAMAAGLPVLCSTVGGIPLAVSHGQEGLLVEPGDVDGLRDALTRMIQDPELRASCGKEAHERARRDFSVQNRVERLVEIYQAYGVVTLS